MTCAECAKYPWNPEFTPDDFPPKKCDTLLPPKRWTVAELHGERKCPMFESRVPVEQPKEPEVEPKPVESDETAPVPLDKPKRAYKRRAS